MDLFVSTVGLQILSTLQNNCIFSKNECCLHHWLIKIFANVHACINMQKLKVKIKTRSLKNHIR